MAEPLKVTAGDSWSWTRSESAYPASDGWVLTYYLAIGAETPKTIICSASGADHAAAVAATASSWPAGKYHWTARVAKGAEKITVGQGVLEVLPDPSAVADRRTHPQKALAAITAVLEGQMGSAIVEYEIDGVKAKKIPHMELIRLRGIYLGKVRREQGGAAVVVIPVEFRHV